MHPEDWHMILTFDCRLNPGDKGHLPLVDDVVDEVATEHNRPIVGLHKTGAAPYKLSIAAAYSRFEHALMAAQKLATDPDMFGYVPSEVRIEPPTTQT